MSRMNERFLRPQRDVVNRPSALKLLLRRQRKFLRPALWGIGGFGAVMACILVIHSTQPGGAIARLRDATALAANMRVQQVVIEGRNNTPEAALNGRDRGAHR